MLFALLGVQSTVAGDDPCAFGDGPAFNITFFEIGDYLFSGVPDPTLTLVRGCTYTFNLNTGGHPFLIKSVSGNGTGNMYNSGVSGNGTQVGTLTFTVPMNAPDTLYYNCSLHVFMGGTINITNGGPPPDVFEDGFENPSPP